MTDYIKREDAVRAMAQYMMDTALIDNPEAADRIKQWEGSIAAPVMSTVPSADVVEVVRCKDCKWHFNQRNLVGCNHDNMGDAVIGYPDDYCSYGEVSHE